MSGGGRWALHLALVAALGAVVVARDDQRALLLFAPLALAPALPWRRAPRWLVWVVPVVVHLLTATTLVFVVAAFPLLLVRNDVAMAGAGALGWGLAVLGVVAVLGRGFWSPVSTLVPAVIGLLVLAALGPGTSLFAWFAGAAALALWIFLFLHGGPRRLDSRLGWFAAVAAATAGGLALLLPWAQPRVERAVVGRLASGSAGLADRSRLGELSHIAASRRIVLRVWTSRTLLRGYVLSRFDGHEWTPPPLGFGRSRATPVLPLREGLSEGKGGWRGGARGALFLLAPETIPPAPGEDLVETRVLLSGLDEWPLLVPAGAVMVRADVSRLEPSGSGGLRFPRFEPVLRYAVLSRPRPLGAGPLSEEERTENLALPGVVDPRLRIRAKLLADGAGSDRERLERTVDWLRTAFSYSLDVGEFESNDPVAEFLFEKKSGYCSYFATAAALLLRLQGVPARYVKGFRVGPHNALGDHSLIRESDAHAWVEAWLPGEGWVEADPTPPAGFAALHGPAPGGLERSLEAVRARAALLWASFRIDGLGAGLAALADLGRDLGRLLSRWPFALALAVAALAGAARLARTRGARARWSSRRRESPARGAALPAGLRGVLRATERHWARRGRARPPSRGLREHLERLPPDALSADARATSARVVDAVYRAAFGGRAVPEAELHDLRRDVARLD